MGALISLANRVKQWFTGTPDEYNPTNDDIRKHHERQDGRDAPTSGSASSPTPEDRDDIPTSGEVSYGIRTMFPFPTVTEYDSTNDHIRKRHGRQDGREALTIGASSFPAPGEVSDKKTFPTSVDVTTISSQLSLVQKNVYLEKETIDPEVWPTKEEFQLAKNRIRYDPEKLHFAVCGGSGAGKSSLINAFRGVKINSPVAAPTGVNETTMTITRYPDPRQELPYKRFVWYDCPGAGTLKTPGWKYFNQQGLFIFDIIILVYATVIIFVNSSSAD
jgi:hypothetical protein